MRWTFHHFKASEIAIPAVKSNLNCPILIQGLSHLSCPWTADKGLSFRFCSFQMLNWPGLQDCFFQSFLWVSLQRLMRWFREHGQPSYQNMTRRSNYSKCLQLDTCTTVWNKTIHTHQYKRRCTNFNRIPWNVGDGYGFPFPTFPRDAMNSFSSECLYFAKSSKYQNPSSWIPSFTLKSRTPTVLNTKLCVQRSVANIFGVVLVVLYKTNLLGRF